MLIVKLSEGYIKKKYLYVSKKWFGTNRSLSDIFLETALKDNFIDWQFFSVNKPPCIKPIFLPPKVVRTEELILIEHALNFMENL